MNSLEDVPVLTTSIDQRGRVTDVTVVEGGVGYTTPPATSLTSDFSSTDKRFGTSSLHSYRGHGEENGYLLTNNEATIETFIEPISLPNSGNQALFLTGGDSDKNRMMFGINNDGKIVYSFRNNDGQSQKVLNNDAIGTDSWSHLLVGHSGGSIFARLNGEEILDSVSDRPLNLVSDLNFSIGADAARSLDGIQYDAFNGHIDEFRVLVGDKSSIFDPRLTTSSHSTQSYTLVIESGDGSDYTFDSDQSDRNGVITDLTDPDINVIISDTLVFDNNSGGHPMEIKDSDDTVVATQDETTAETTFTPATTGTYTYQCTVAGHENMIGNIIVAAQPDPVISLPVPTAPFDSDANTALLRHFDGDSAELSLTLTNGSVSSVTIVDSGLGYISAPTVTIARSADGGDFLIGETVTQINTSYTIKGEVTRWSDSDRILQLAHVGSTDGTFKQFSTTKPIVGASSSAQWVPKLVEDLQEIQPTAQNKVFDDFEADFLDFSESNPFGDMF